MSKCRVFVVVDTEGKACAIYDNKLSAWDYVNARDPECFGIVPYELQSEFVKPPRVWMATIDGMSNSHRMSDFLDWDDEYGEPSAEVAYGAALFVFGKRVGDQEWLVQGCSRESPEDALRVAREKMKEHNQSRTT